MLNLDILPNLNVRCSLTPNESNKLSRMNTISAWQYKRNSYKRAFKRTITNSPQWKFPQSTVAKFKNLAAVVTCPVS